jgi:hypothetical protein
MESYACRFTSHSFRHRDKPEANQRAVPDLTQCASFHQGARYHHDLQENEDDKTHDPLLRRSHLLRTTGHPLCSPSLTVPDFD